MTSESITASRQTLSVRHVRIIFLLALAIMIDGVDSLILPYVSPVLIKDWGIDSLKLAPAIGISALGMALGTFVGGRLADAVGNKPVIVASIVLFAVCSGLCAFSQTIETLMALRFMSGIGFGAVFPAVMAMIGSTLPVRVRSMAVGIVSIGYPVGAIAGAILAGWLVPVAGWRMCFAIAGGLSFLVAVILAVFLPTSQNLSGFGDSSSAIESQDIQKGDDTPVVGYGAALSPIYRRTTIAIIELFLFSVVVSLGILQWSPLFLTSMGYTIEEALRASAIYNVTGIAGSLIWAYFLPRLGSLRLIVISQVIVLVLLLGLLFSLWNFKEVDGNFIVTIFAIATFLLMGLISILHTTAVQAYPAPIRGTGLAFGTTAARLAGLVASLAGGALLAISHEAFLGGLCLAALLGLVTSTHLDRHIKGSG